MKILFCFVFTLFFTSCYQSDQKKKLETHHHTYKLTQSHVSLKFETKNKISIQYPTQTYSYGQLKVFYKNESETIKIVEHEVLSPKTFFVEHHFEEGHLFATLRLKSKDGKNKIAKTASHFLNLQNEINEIKQRKKNSIEKTY